MNYPRLSILTACCVLAFPAYATKPVVKPPTEKPVNPPTVTTSASLSQGMNQNQTQGQQQTTTASTGGVGMDVGFESDMLALDLPGFGEAPTVTDCHVSRGSLGFLGAGSGGKVSIDASCLKHRQCMERVSTLERLGQTRLAVEMTLTECGVKELPPGFVYEEPPPKDIYVTQEQLERAFNTATGKQ
jgi:hypothetical protein